MKESDVDPKLYLAAKDLAAGVYRFCGQMTRNERDVAGSEMYASAIELLNNVKLGKDHRKTVIQPVTQGVDFTGYVILPWRIRPRRSLLSNARERLTFLRGIPLPSGQ